MSEEKPTDTQDIAKEKADAKKLPPFKLTPDKPGQNPKIYSDEQAAADWKMVEARLEARGITSGF